MLGREDLHKEQLACINWMLEKKLGCISPECGSGKTVIGLTAYQTACELAKQKKTLLVVSTPKAIKETWSRENKNWEHLKDLDIAMLTGNPDARYKVLETIHDVYCISYNLLEWFCSVSHRPSFSFVIADEGSCLKGPTSKWRKYLTRLTGNAEYKFILTATPAPHDAMDYWGLCKYLDDGECLRCPTITSFRAEYCKSIPIPHTSGVRYELYEDRVPEIEKKIEPLFYTFKTENVKEIEIKDIPVECTYSSKAMALYKKIQKEQCLNSIVYDANGQAQWADALNALSLFAKLCQITNGFVYVDEYLKLEPETLAALNERELAKAVKGKKRVFDLFPDRIELCKQIVGGIRGKYDGQIAIVYLFKHDLEVLKNAFPEGVSDEEEGIAERWNKKEIPLLFLQYARSSKGLNLQKGGNRIIIYSSTFNWEHDYQMIRRFARQGQEEDCVFVYRMVAKGTIDEDSVAALEERGVNHANFQKKVLRNLFEGIDKNN